ncbi:hypothetical protein, partial [Tardiphaga sp.]|uniref:hypothetical protein n=1 Tax=Tardiphaga sp. TaxID=1926292 RepID=UPI0037DA610C
MSDTRSTSNLSKRQVMVSTAGDLPGAGRSGDWGLKNLAIDPGKVQESRGHRDANFESLSVDASTMFEQFRINLEQHVGSN